MIHSIYFHFMELVLWYGYKMDHAMEFLFVRGGDFDFVEHSKNSKASCNVNTLQHNTQRLVGVNISLSRYLANKLSPLTSKLTSLLYVDWAEMSFWRGGRG